MPERTAKQMYERVMQAKKVLLVSHQNPDGDTLGAATAFIQFLKKQQKPYTAFCRTGTNPGLGHLPHLKEMTSDQTVWTDPLIDTVIVFDSGDPVYAGISDLIQHLPQKPFVLNMDHHATNQLFGDLNLVITTASSTTEILYGFFLTNHVPVDSTMATSLLTGLVTDTDHFTNAATSKRSLKFASDLVLKGGNLTLIKEQILRNKHLTSLKLWGKVLARLDHHKELDIIHTHITQADIMECHASEHDIEGIANFLNSLKDGRASLFLKEMSDGTIKGSFRTTRDDVDVSQFAKALGGGGHKKAAGFSVSPPIDTASSRVWEVIRTMEK